MAAAAFPADQLGVEKHRLRKLFHIRDALADRRLHSVEY
jgi:hypothetical protein